MRLTTLERQSAVWIRLEAYLNEQLKSLRSQNDGDLDPIATSRLRGRVMAIRQILSLAEEREIVQAEAD